MFYTFSPTREGFSLLVEELLAFLPNFPLPEAAPDEVAMASYIVDRFGKNDGVAKRSKTMNTV